MTTIEAYRFAMIKVNELKESGIQVIIKPSQSRDNKEIIKKYDKPDRISSELWNHITFENLNTIQAQKIMEIGNYLGMCGITFDTGGFIGHRDWEFDWSFSYKQGEENWQWRDAREDMEDMIINE